MTVHSPTCTAFEGHHRIASGALPDVALAVREVFARGEQAPVTVFDDVTSRPVEFDLRGTPDEIVARLASQMTAPKPLTLPTTPQRTRHAAVAGQAVWWREKSRCCRVIGIG